MSLISTLQHTVVWLRFREALKDHPLARTYLEELWPEGNVPRQAEVTALHSRIGRLTRLVVALLERSERQGTLSQRLVAEAVRLGVELPQTIREKVQ